MFDIKNSRDFYSKCLDDYMSLLQTPTYAGFAINCALSTYHLSEWIWGDWLKTDERIKAKLGIRTCDEFKRWVDKNCRYFETVQSVANGSKHFNRRIAAKTSVVETSVEEGDQQHLVIDVSSDETRSFEDVIESMLNFWYEFLDEHSPYENLASPHEEERKWF